MSSESPIKCDRNTQIAALNHIEAPYVLLIGQRLWLPDTEFARGTWRDASPIARQYAADEGLSEATWTIGRSFLFVLADEVLPSGKVVRKVGVRQKGGSPDVSLRAATERLRVENPEVYGIKPLEPHSKVSIGEHAMGNNISRYTSASGRPGGAPHMHGRPVWIDIEKAKRAGVVFHSTEEIIKDLDRLAAANPAMADRIARLKQVIATVEHEVLLEGNIPARAIKSVESMHVTRALRFIQVVGVLMTAVDLTRASVKSVKQQRPAPIAAEAIRQTGGWGGATIGGLAGAWAAAKVGGVAGGTLFVETGPGALFAGAAGALIFGAAGYFAADWVADLIDQN